MGSMVNIYIYIYKYIYIVITSSSIKCIVYIMIILSGSA